MTPAKLDSCWHFRSIGLGTINYRVGARRLAKEAASTGLFTTSFGFDENYLKEKSPVFWRNHENIFKARTMGFGYYIWKPEFIRLALAEIPENHGLMYCDAGNLVSGDKDDIKMLASYLDIARNANIVGSNSQEFAEKDWSPNELMDHLNLSQQDRNSNQFLGGFLLITNTVEGRNFVENWSTLVCQANHQFSYPPNGGYYDQASLSCLLKSWKKPSVEIGDKAKPGCVRAARHRFAYSIDTRNLLEILYYKLASRVSKVKLALERRIFKNSLYQEPTNHA